MFGLSGSSRTGKTTLAKQIAEDLGIRYFDASVTKIMQGAGYNPVGALTIDERIDAQVKLLDTYTDAIHAVQEIFITDRTPLDFIGYMLGEVSMTNTTEDQGRRIDDYVRRCLDTTRKLFTCIAIVRPLPFYEAAEDKPKPNPAYQRHVQFIIEGAAQSLLADLNLMTAVTTEFEERRVGFRSGFAQSMGTFFKERAGVSSH